MNTLIIYNVISNKKVLETRSFIVNEKITTQKEALISAKAHYNGDDEVQIQGIIGVTDEELEQESITRVIE